MIQNGNLNGGNGENQEVWRYPNFETHVGPCPQWNSLLPAVPYEGPTASHHILAGNNGRQVDASRSCSFTEGWKCLDCNAIKMFLLGSASKASTFNCWNMLESYWDNALSKLKAITLFRSKCTNSRFVNFTFSSTQNRSCPHFPPIFPWQKLECV